MRIPQEDGCQALGTPSAAKYEADGGPGLADIARLLHGSESRDADLALLFRAQALFRMLAATDGHAKNFSLHLLAGGRYRLTTLYDVLSARPVVGRSANHFDSNELTLAMALRGKNRHCRLAEIRRRHFEATARACGLGEAVQLLIEDVLAQTPRFVEQVGAALPRGFPGDVFETVARGMGQVGQPTRYGSRPRRRSRRRRSAKAQFQQADTGLSATLTVAGTKYFKDPDPN